MEESKITEPKQVTLQLMNPYSQNVHKLVDVSIGQTASEAIKDISQVLNLNPCCNYEFVYMAGNAPLAIAPDAIVFQYWHMSKLFINIVPAIADRGKKQMYCNQCTLLNDADLIYCSNCTTILHSGRRICGKCQQEIAVNSLYCSSCGLEQLCKLKFPV